MTSIEEALKSNSSRLKTYEKADKSKAGRKPLAKEERRTNVITLKFNDNDFNILKKLADEDLEESVHHYIRKLVLKKIKS